MGGKDRGLEQGDRSLESSDRAAEQGDRAAEQGDLLQAVMIEALSRASSVT